MAARRLSRFDEPVGERQVNAPPAPALRTYDSFDDRPRKISAWPLVAHESGPNGQSTDVLWPLLTIRENVFQYFFHLFPLLFFLKQSKKTPELLMIILAGFFVYHRDAQGNTKWALPFLLSFGRSRKDDGYSQTYILAGLIARFTSRGNLTYAHALPLFFTRRRYGPAPQRVPADPNVGVLLPTPNVLLFKWTLVGLFYYQRWWHASFSTRGPTDEAAIQALREAVAAPDSHRTAAGLAARHELRIQLSGCFLSFIPIMPLLFFHWRTEVRNVLHIWPLFSRIYSAGHYKDVAVFYPFFRFRRYLTDPSLETVTYHLPWPFVKFVFKAGYRSYRFLPFVWIKKGWDHHAGFVMGFYWRSYPNRFSTWGIAPFFHFSRKLDPELAHLTTVGIFPFYLNHKTATHTFRMLTPFHISFWSAAEQWLVILPCFYLRYQNAYRLVRGYFLILWSIHVHNIKSVVRIVVPCFLRSVSSFPDAQTGKPKTIVNTYFMPFFIRKDNGNNRVKTIALFGLFYRKRKAIGQSQTYLLGGALGYLRIFAHQVERAYFLPLLGVQYLRQSYKHESHQPFLFPLLCVTRYLDFNTGSYAFNLNALFWFFRFYFKIKLTAGSWNGLLKLQFRLAPLFGFTLPGIPITARAPDMLPSSSSFAASAALQHRPHQPQAFNLFPTTQDFYSLPLKIRRILDTYPPFSFTYGLKKSLEAIPYMDVWLFPIFCFYRDNKFRSELFAFLPLLCGYRHSSTRSDRQVRISVYPFLSFIQRTDEFLLRRLRLGLFGLLYADFLNTQGRLGWFLFPFSFWRQDYVPNAYPRFLANRRLQQSILHKTVATAAREENLLYEHRMALSWNDSRFVVSEQDAFKLEEVQHLLKIFNVKPPNFAEDIQAPAPVASSAPPLSGPGVTAVSSHPLSFDSLPINVMIVCTSSFKYALLPLVLLFERKHLTSNVRAVFPYFMKRETGTDMMSSKPQPTKTILSIMWPFIKIKRSLQAGQGKRIHSRFFPFYSYEKTNVSHLSHPVQQPQGNQEPQVEPPPPQQQQQLSDVTLVVMFATHRFSLFRYQVKHSLEYVLGKPSPTTSLCRKVSTFFFPLFNWNRSSRVETSSSPIAAAAASDSSVAITPVHDPHDSTQCTLLWVAPGYGFTCFQRIGLSSIFYTILLFYRRAATTFVPERKTRSQTSIIWLVHPLAAMYFVNNSWLGIERDSSRPLELGGTRSFVASPGVFMSTERLSTFHLAPFVYYAYEAPPTDAKPDQKGQSVLSLFFLFPGISLAHFVRLQNLSLSFVFPIFFKTHRSTRYVSSLDFASSTQQFNYPHTSVFEKFIAWLGKSDSSLFASVSSLPDIKFGLRDLLTGNGNRSAPKDVRMTLFEQKPHRVDEKQMDLISFFWFLSGWFSLFSHTKRTHSTYASSSHNSQTPTREEEVLCQQSFFKRTILLPLFWREETQCSQPLTQFSSHAVEKSYLFLIHRAISLASSWSASSILGAKDALSYSRGSFIFPLFYSSDTKDHSTSAVYRNKAIGWAFHPSISLFCQQFSEEPLYSKTRSFLRFAPLSAYEELYTPQEQTKRLSVFHIPWTNGAYAFASRIWKRETSVFANPALASTCQESINSYILFLFWRSHVTDLQSKSVKAHWTALWLLFPRHLALLSRKYSLESKAKTFESIHYFFPLWTYRRAVRNGGKEFSSARELSTRLSLLWLLHPRAALVQFNERSTFAAASAAAVELNSIALQDSSSSSSTPSAQTVEWFTPATEQSGLLLRLSKRLFVWPLFFTRSVERSESVASPSFASGSLLRKPTLESSSGFLYLSQKLSLSFFLQTFQAMQTGETERMQRLVPFFHFTSSEKPVATGVDQPMKLETQSRFSAMYIPLLQDVVALFCYQHHSEPDSTKLWFAPIFFYGRHASQFKTLWAFNMLWIPFAPQLSMAGIHSRQSSTPTYVIVHADQVDAPPPPPPDTVHKFQAWFCPLGYFETQKTVPGRQRPGQKLLPPQATILSLLYIFHHRLAMVHSNEKIQSSSDTSIAIRRTSWMAPLFYQDTTSTQVESAQEIQPEETTHRQTSILWLFWHRIALLRSFAHTTDTTKNSTVHLFPFIHLETSRDTSMSNAVETKKHLSILYLIPNEITLVRFRSHAIGDNTWKTSLALPPIFTATMDVSSSSSGFFHCALLYVPFAAEKASLIHFKTSEERVVDQNDPISSSQRFYFFPLAFFDTIENRQQSDRESSRLSFLWLFHPLLALGHRSRQLKAMSSSQDGVLSEAIEVTTRSWMYPFFARELTKLENLSTLKRTAVTSFLSFLPAISPRSSFIFISEDMEINKTTRRREREWFILPLFYSSSLQSANIDRSATPAAPVDSSFAPSLDIGVNWNECTYQEYTKAALWFFRPEAALIHYNTVTKPRVNFLSNSKEMESNSICWFLPLFTRSATYGSQNLSVRCSIVSLHPSFGLISWYNIREFGPVSSCPAFINSINASEQNPSCYFTKGWYILFGIRHRKQAWYFFNTAKGCQGALLDCHRKNVRRIPSAAEASSILSAPVFEQCDGIFSQSDTQYCWFAPRRGFSLAARHTSSVVSPKDVAKKEKEGDSLSYVFPLFLSKSDSRISAAVLRHRGEPAPPKTKTVDRTVSILFMLHPRASLFGFFDSQEHGLDPSSSNNNGDIESPRLGANGAPTRRRHTKIHLWPFILLRRIEKPEYTDNSLTLLFAGPSVGLAHFAKRKEFKNLALTIRFYIAPFFFFEKTRTPRTDSSGLPLPSSSEEPDKSNMDSVIVLSVIFLAVRQLALIRYRWQKDVEKMVFWPICRYERVPGVHLKWCVLPMVPVKFHMLANLLAMESIRDQAIIAPSMIQLSPSSMIPYEPSSIGRSPYMVNVEDVELGHIGQHPPVVAPQAVVDTKSRRRKYVRFLYRVARYTEENGISTWEINPIFSAESEPAAGYKSWAILGGLLGHERMKEKSRTRVGYCITL